MPNSRIRLRAPRHGRLCLSLLPWVAALVPVMPLTALAQAQAQAQAQLDPVIVTGTREAQLLRHSVADVVLVDAASIRDSSADSVEDLLRRHAGVQIVRNGGPGQSSGYLLRGMSTSGTVVLIDGVRVGSATLGQAELESMSLAQIDHIEVLRGPASSLYGADAVGGVIQIFTRRGAGAPHVTGNFAVGGYNSYEGNVGVSGAFGDAQRGFDYAASVGRESSDGVSAIRPNDQFGSYNPDKDGFKRTVANARLGFTPAAGQHLGLNLSRTQLNAQYDSADYPPPTYAPDASPDFRNRLDTTLLALDYRGQLSAFWSTSLQASMNDDDSLSGGGMPSRYKTERRQYTWQNALHFSPEQQLVLAYEQVNERASGDIYTDKPQVDNKALMAGYTGQFAALVLEASVRQDDNSAYGKNSTGNLGLSYGLSGGLKLRALAGKTFRAPTFNDRLYPGYGVPTIQPERGESVELGLAWQAASSSASVTVYRNKVRDLIGYDSDPSGSHCPSGYFGCAANVSRATLQGATLSAAQRWGGLRLSGTVDVLNAKDDLSGQRLNRRAAHQESLAADYDAGAWTVGASLLDVGARPDGNIQLSSYTLLDLRASWRFLPQWRLEAKLLNAADRNVEPVRDYQALGRQAWIGLRFDGKGF